MKLSMWIIANLLESFEPEVHIRRESPRVLRSARLAYATDCVLVQQDGPDCLYLWNEDSIRLPDLSAREGFELLQSLFDSMFDWEGRISEAMEQRNFQALVEEMGVVFKNPIVLTDANHACLACSAGYGPEAVDREWQHLKTYGYSSFASTKEISEARLSYHMDGKVIRFRFPEGSGMSDSLSISLFQGEMPVGYLTILGGVSLSRRGFAPVPRLLEQAEYALRAPGRKKGFFTDYYYLAMDHLIRSPYDPERCLAACQPDVYRLFCQDEVLYQTLWAYLMQDRSVTRTVQMLFVHKNTLLYRLRRIEDSLQYSFSDPYTRSYMRFSFLLLERHAGLPNPPVAAFEMPEV